MAITTQQVQTILQDHLQNSTRPSNPIAPLATGMTLLAEGLTGLVTRSPHLPPAPSSDPVDVVLGWQDQVHNRPATLPSLLYRHYLVQHALHQDILFTTIIDRITFLLTTFPQGPCAFGPVGLPDLYADPLVPSELLAHWRRVTPALTSYVTALSNRADVTAHQLLRDHALLSSVTLMYIVVLARIWLLDLHARHANAASSVVYQDYARTFDALKGAVFHVEKHFLVAGLS